MTQKELTTHATVITEAVLDNMYSTVSNYMEDVLEHDPYMTDFSAVHDELFFECVKAIGNLQINIK
jgi:hypothetical protein